jgi:hypothetical protein
MWLNYFNSSRAFKSLQVAIGLFASLNPWQGYSIKSPFNATIQENCFNIKLQRFFLVANDITTLMKSNFIVGDNVYM